MWTTLHRVGAVALVIIVAAQAVIAGQHLFGDWGIGLHAALGNAGFAVTVVTAAIAITKRHSRSSSVIGVVLVVLMSAQIGLGYSARESEAAAALHIPIGVAVFGAVVFQLLAAWPELLVDQD